MSVVVGYVPTETGFFAIREAEREARSLGVPLIVVNVIGPAGYSTPTAADEQAMDSVTAYLTKQDIEHEVRQVTDADSPADALLEVAERAGAKLIVLGLHRRSRVGKALLGSTTQTVVLRASCPVLTVPDVD